MVSTSHENPARPPDALEHRFYATGDRRAVMGFSVQGRLARWFGKGDGEQAKALVQQGDAAFMKDDFSKAESFYRDAVAVAPEFAPAHLGLGAALQSQGRFHDAVGALTSALDIDSKLVNAHELLAASHLALSDLGKAEPHLRRAIDLDRNGRSNYMHLGEILASQRRYQEALQVVMQGAARIPDFADLQFFLGNLHFEMGSLEQAVATYRETVKLQPGHFMAWYNLGLVLIKTEQPEAARDALQHAIELQPDWPEALVNMGCTYYRLGKLNEAKAIFEDVLLRRPDLATAWFNLGEIAMAQGELAGAVAHYQKTLEIDPDSADGHRCLGKGLLQIGAREGAIAHLQRSLDIAPGDVDTLMQLAALRQAQGELEPALAHFREARVLNPRHVGALIGVASVLQQRVQEGALSSREVLLEEAVVAAQAAVALDDGNVQARLILGTTLGMLGRHDEADSRLREVLAIDPQCIGAHHNLGVTMEERGRQVGPPENMACLTEALEHYSAVVSVAPGDLDALMGVASIYSLLLRDEEAAAAYERILQIDPGYAPGIMSFGVLKLRAGDFATGWRYMEERWNLGKAWRRVKSDKPSWDGKAELNGKTILLFNEQGFGDALQFIRYTGLLAQSGASVLVKVDPALKLLCANSPGVLEVFSGDEIPEHDFHCSLASLPGIFGTTSETIPGPFPYLRAAPERILHWGRKFGSDRNLRVGLVWAGDPRLQDDKMRSLHFDRLRSLLTVPNTTFYSLQLGEASRQLQNASGVVDFTAEMLDFQETAALAAHLDLAICVDTSVVHLLGAIGKPVWLLNRFNSCWRWMLNRSDSPWYPALRIFRQPQVGEWDGVIAEVRQALEIEAARKAGA